MITLINSESKLKGVNKIVFGETTLTKYNEDKLVNTDLIEYGFSALIEKIKYNNNRLLDFFDDTVFDLFDQNPKELSKLENNYIFPTVSNKEDTTNSLNYFYVATIQKKTLIVFNVPENIDKVYVYGENEGETPDITLEFGPVVENPLTYEEALQSDEVTSEKTIFMTLTLSEEDPTYNSVNVTYYIWKNSINSNRNKNKYSLRNDEFFSSIYSSSIISDSSQFRIDDSTGTLLCSNAEDSIISTTPILSLKKEQWGNNNVYNPKISYKLGDIVEFGRYKDNYEDIKPYKYISLCNNNINNTPCFSSKWILEDKFSDYLMTKINIIIYPEEAASITPEGSINISKDSDLLNFQVNYKPGYKLDIDSESGYASVSFVDDPENNITDNITGVITNAYCSLSVDKAGIDKVLSKKQIIFKFKHTEYSLRFNTYVNSVLENIRKRVEISQDSGNTWTIVNGNQSGSSYDGINVDSNTLIKVTLLDISSENYLKVNQPIIASGVLGEDKMSNKAIELKQTEDTLSYYFIDSPSFVERTTYTINVSSILHETRVIGDLKYLEVEKIFIETQHNKSFKVRFYKAKNYKHELLATPRVNVLDESGNIIATLTKTVVFNDENIVLTDTNKFTYTQDRSNNIYTLEVEKAEKNYVIQLICKL
jgi:hypothetical protein